MAQHMVRFREIAGGRHFVFCYTKLSPRWDWEDAPSRRYEMKILQTSVSFLNLWFVIHILKQRKNLQKYMFLEKILYYMILRNASLFESKIQSNFFKSGKAKFQTSATRAADAPKRTTIIAANSNSIISFARHL